MNRGAADRDLDDELRHYLDEATEAQVANGLSPAAARRAARIETGSLAAAREQVRDHGWENALGLLLSDLRFTGRMLRKSPVFTTVVVFVISLGSGAVTTIFSGMNAMVLRPLPGLADPGRLVGIRPARGDGTAAEQGSYGYYTYLRERTRTLDGVAAWGRVSLTIADEAGGSAALGNMVSGNYFDVLGVRPALGRFFSADEDRTPRSHPVVVVSHAFWTSRLRGDPAAIGRTLNVSGHPFTLIGVAPDAFQGVYTGLEVDAWVPLMMQPLLRPRANLTTASWLWLFGRLQDGVSIESAQHELTAITAVRAAEAGAGRAQPFTAARLSTLTGLPNGEGGPLLVFMSVMLGAAALVLVIGGLNIAAMLSARYVARRREMAVRAALGAGRARLLRQLLTEILALFLLGAGGGFAIAHIATGALERLPLPDHVPVTLELSPDLRVLAFAVGVSLLAGLVFGLAPARKAARRDLTADLRDGLPGSGVRRSLLGRALIVGQLACSLVLLVAAGLFIRALDRGSGVDPGFDRDGIVIASLEPEAWGYDVARARRFYTMLRERVAAVPGVTAVSYTGRVPLMLGSSPDEITLEPGADAPVHTASVDLDYFSVLRLPLVQGRAFTRADDERAARVAVVNETLARRLWPDGHAVGRTFRFRDAVTTIVGIARDASYASLDETTPSFVYLPLAQVWQPTQTLMVRSAGPSAGVAATIQQAVVAIDPRLPPPRVATLRQATGIVLLPQRAAAIITGMLGGIGLLLAAVGLYGVMAFSASQRTREIGIRVALGADRARVVRGMVREGMQLAAAGILVGVPLAAIAARLIEGWLFGINPLDGATFAGMSVLFSLVAFAASYWPARRAASLDPLTALRAE
jgi:predicted permease